MTSNTAERPDQAVAVGVDGCRGGWVAVEWTAGTDRPPTAELITDLAPLLLRLRRGAVAAVAIDMPIGLPETGPRQSDIEARRLLGPRRSSVFPTPVRATLAAGSYAEACALSRRASGKALSKQAYNLLPKIRELDRLVEPEDQDRLVEAHPECAFARLAGEPLPHPKRTEAGRTERRELLARHDPALGLLVGGATDLPILDLIDATVLAVTAARVVAGSEIRLGSGHDARGLATQLVY